VVDHPETEQPRDHGHPDHGHHHADRGHHHRREGNGHGSGAQADRRGRDRAPGGAGNHRRAGRGEHHHGGHAQDADDSGPDHGGHGDAGHDRGAHDRSGHDHGAHNHGAHDHGGHDHAGHGHGGHGDAGHDRGAHDRSGHDHSAHDHGAHDHGGHDHAGHDHAGHGHGGADGRLRRLWHSAGHLVTPHSHDSSDKVDAALEGSREGLRALWISLAVLGVTAVLQGLVTWWSGSVALLGDALHNTADALTAIPLGVAFLIGRRPATRRYTYGYGRAEDLAGIVIVGVIAVSSLLAGYAAVRRLAHPAGVQHLVAVAVAALLGFAGNEIVARYRIGVGRRIGSAALVADGLHARTDGFTSLAVLLGAGGTALGWHWADPVVGLLITLAILLVLKDAAAEVYRRLMDAVDPHLVDEVARTLRGTEGVLDVGDVHLRWIGHHLRAECAIVVPAELTVTAAHAIAVQAEHRLIHALPRLERAFVHADPLPDPGGADPHAALRHHQRQA
jgi:cation diffusion facilitator family transporter